MADDIINELATACVCGPLDADGACLSCCARKEIERLRRWKVADDFTGIRIYMKVTGISAAHRRYYRRLRKTYSREMAQWVFAGRALPYEDLRGPALMVAVAAANYPDEIEQAHRG